MYAHLVRDITHSKHCNLSRGLCASDCDWANFHGELGAPILTSERRRAQQFEERRRALMAGEIPA